MTNISRSNSDKIVKINEDMLMSELELCEKVIEYHKSHGRFVLLWHSILNPCHRERFMEEICSKGRICWEATKANEAGVNVAISLGPESLGDIIGEKQMAMRTLFWIVMLLTFLSTGWHSYNSGWSIYIGGGLIEFLLFLLLGWKVFGAPVEG